MFCVDVNEAPKDFVVDKNFTEYHAVNGSWWFRLKENTQSVIANIRYTDEDAGQDHTYSTSLQFDAQFFTLTHKGLGLFELATSGLSAEVHDNKCFDVIVTDNGQPPKSGFKTICFDVLGNHSHVLLELWTFSFILRLLFQTYPNLQPLCDSFVLMVTFMVVRTVLLSTKKPSPALTSNRRRRSALPISAPTVTRFARLTSRLDRKSELWLHLTTTAMANLCLL